MTGRVLGKTRLGLWWLARLTVLTGGWQAEGAGLPRSAPLLPVHKVGAFLNSFLSSLTLDSHFHSFIHPFFRRHPTTTFLFIMPSLHRLLAASCLLASLASALVAPSPSHHVVELHAKHKYPARQLNESLQLNVTNPSPPLQSDFIDISSNGSSTIGDLANNHTQITANLCVILGINYTDPAANLTQLATNQTQAPEHISRSVFGRLLCKCIGIQNATMSDSCTPVDDILEDIPALLGNGGLPKQGGSDGNTPDQDGVQAGSGTSGGSTPGAPTHGAGSDDGNRAGGAQQGESHPNGPHTGANGGTHPPPGNNGSPGARPEGHAQPTNGSNGGAQSQHRPEGNQNANGNGNANGPNTPSGNRQTQANNAAQSQPQSQGSQNANGNANGSNAPSAKANNAAQPQHQPQGNQNANGNANGPNASSGNTQTQANNAAQPQPQSQGNQNPNGNANGPDAPSGNTQTQTNNAPRPQDQTPSNQGGGNGHGNTGNTSGQNGAGSSSSPSSSSGNGGSTAPGNNGGGDGSNSGNGNDPTISIHLPNAPGVLAIPGDVPNVPDVPATIVDANPTSGAPQMCARASVDANACAGAGASM
ncbi:hypothetical protein NEOLEDRAFT_1168582 [Neolentinus lepideus HHB14362 ss-1]|uniref:Uncharacterized protein n=1 Tax=Neolentinus lepideus HHB14362 ss-1 TaxID=1314782 RepID=A0A165THX0_9AGAM|nr:hypothetical protein NEOLEDRAFT_1168582 [Neolentinus lepideus HHB14362 ss-1]